MIEVKNLTKIYNEKSVKQFKALDSVSFTLQNKGMVFILGKSGSGKSTLLNLLGGLDKITSGDIIADGNQFSSFSENDYDNYRNNYLGFVFQDFCLINNLNIYQNVQMSLKLRREKDKNFILQTLESVGLKGYEKRYPKELSGGQKQRVAIARAIVKKPKLILADEPTGNLDSKTSKQILNIFKELSKENLVVIVSHNREDAETYADRIIELSDGKIVADVIKNKKYKNAFSIKGDEIVLPDRKLTENEIVLLNKKIKQKECKIILTPDKFVETKKCEDKQRNIVFENKSMSFFSSFKIAYDFLKSRKITLIFTFLFVLLIITLLSVCQMFVRFDDGKVVNEALAKKNEQVFVLKKGYLADDKDYVRWYKNSYISQEEIDLFYKNGYSGNIFKLYNTPLPISRDNCVADNFGYEKDDERYMNFYANEGVGVLQCDLNYLNNLFAVNGGVQVLSGSIRTSSNKLIITDYFADSLLYYNVDNIFDTTSSDKYEKITSADKIFNRYSVCAVIKTDYKEKYGNLIEKFFEYSKKENIALLKDFVKSDEFVGLIEDLSKYYAVAYTLNTNYVQTEISMAVQNDVTSKKWFTNFGEVIYKDELGMDVTSSKESKVFIIDKAYNSSLQQGEIYMPIKEYNKYFNTNYNTPNFSSEIQKYIYLTHYNKDFENVTSVPAYTKIYNVVGIIDDSCWVINSFDFEEMYYSTLYPTALYFDNTDNVANIYHTGSFMQFVVNASYFNAVTDLTNIVGIFKDYFGAIAGVLCLVAVLLLINFGYSSVKSNIFEIGVIKALGGKNRSISFAFVLQMLFIGLLICVSALFLSFVFVSTSNTIIVNSFINFYQNNALKDLTVLQFLPNILFMDLVITILISLFSALFPIFKLKKIKPYIIMKLKN